MKRSHAIMLGATGIILAGAWLGSGSGRGPDDAKDAAVYNDVDECIRAGVLSGDTCREQFNEASYRHLERAPKFASQSACEVEYGASQCKSSTWNGASVFVPAMIGFLVANHLANNRQPQALMPPLRRATPCPPGQTPETMPGCYAQRQSTGSSSSGSSGSSGSSAWRSYSTSGGDTVSRRENAPGGVAKVPGSAAIAPATRTSIGAVLPRAPSVSGSSSRSSSISSSSSTSRGGFGSTGRSFSTSS